LASILNARRQAQHMFFDHIDDFRTMILADTLDRATELVRPGGTVGVLGTFWEPVALGMAFQMKEVTLVPAFTYGHHHGTSEFADAIVARLES